MAEQLNYTEIIKEHFFNPRNFLKNDAEAEFVKTADGFGEVGNPICGDVMKLWIKIDKQNDKIIECKWQTFGCVAAIATTSMLSVMVTENSGMPIQEALSLTPQEIVKRLGAIPPKKFHCAVLGNRALKAALNHYFRKTEQYARIIPLEGNILDEKLKFTDKEVSEWIKNGAKSIAQIEEKLGAKIDNPETKAKLVQMFKIKENG
ncbi:MAG: iron-sulfur cluster assembly scaffold protein [Candidatus Nanoarchaeia archaeon]